MYQKAHLGFIHKETRVIPNVEMTRVLSSELVRGVSANHDLHGKGISGLGLFFPRPVIDQCQRGLTGFFGLKA